MSMRAASQSEHPRSGFEIGAGRSADVGITLWGDLGLGWFGRLSTALARRGLSIQSAQAARSSNDSWTGSLELLTGAAMTDPYSLDYLKLCDEAAIERNPEPRFDGFRVDRTSAGSLELRFSAVDQIGLLSALLDRLEFLGLFPERLRVTTNADLVQDTLWLRGVAGNEPSVQVEQSLRDLMARLTHSNGLGHH